MSHARSNIAVSNQTISGDFTPNVVVVINGTDRTTNILMASLRVTLARSEEPDTAEFVIERNPGYTPTAGQSVTVALGSSDNPVFSGQILTIEHQRDRSGVYPMYAVHCVDWTRLLNRRLVTYDYSGMAAHNIARHIVENYTSGFYPWAVDGGLDTVDQFVCINETPTSALGRLANEIGGGFFVSARRIIHLWDSSGPQSAWKPCTPSTLTDSLSSLKSFAPEYDFSQLRTRVITEGQQGSIAVTIPARSVIADINTYGIPLEYPQSYAFNPSTHPHGNYARIGTMVFTYYQTNLVIGPPVCTLTADAAAGTVFLSVDDNTPLRNTLYFGGSDLAGWAHDGRGNYFRYYAALATTTLLTVPASGYGSLQVDLVAGTPLYMACSLVLTGIDQSPIVLSSDITVGTPIVVRMVEEDTTAQSAIAAIEGGDGIHEYFISNPNLTYLGCSWRAAVELNVFADALIRASWVTYDQNANPGAQQVLNMSSPDAITGTLTIDTVSLTWPKDNYWPRRECQGSTVKLDTVLEAIEA